MFTNKMLFDSMLDDMNERHMQCDIYEKNNVYFIEMDLPGYNKEDISIEWNKGNIVIRASREETVEEDKKYIRRERRNFGKIERTFYFGEMDEEGMQASFTDGILTVSIPKKDENFSKKMIEIK